MNPIIEVNGDTATGHWLLFQPMVIKTGKDTVKETGVWLAATYNDLYVWTAEGWKMKHLTVETAFQTPYEDGWAKTRYLDGKPPVPPEKPSKM